MKAKNLFFSILCAGVFNAAAQSPGFRYGPRFGFGESEFRQVNVMQKSKLAVNAGISASQQFSNNLALEGGLLFVNKGGRMNSYVQNGTDVFGNPRTYSYQDVFDLAYAEVPLMLKLSLGFHNFHVKGFAGPVVAFNIFSTQTRFYDDPDYNANNSFSNRLRDTEVTEFSATYGAGIEIENPAGQLFFLDLRRSEALNSFGKVEGREALNTYFCVSAGYMFK